MKKFCVLLIACSLFSIATMAQTTNTTQTPSTTSVKSSTPAVIDSLSVKLSIKDINELFQGFDVASNPNTGLPKTKTPSDEMVASLTSFQHIKELIVAQYNLATKKKTEKPIIK